MGSSTTPAIGFLSLPTEMRLMIYEFLPNRTVRTEYVRSVDGVTASFFSLITSSAQTAILSTCRTINREAEAIMRTKTNQLLQSRICNRKRIPALKGPDPRIESDSEGLRILCSENGLIKAISEWAIAIQERRFNDMEASMATCGFEPDPFLRMHGYTLKGGSHDAGIRRLRSFIYRSGWMLHFQYRNITPFRYKPPMIHLALAQTSLDMEDQMHDVYLACKTLTFFPDVTAVYVMVSTLSITKMGAPADRSFAIRASHLIRNDSSENVHHAIRWGLRRLDEKEKDIYERFWTDGEWL